MAAIIGITLALQFVTKGDICTIINRKQLSSYQWHLTIDTVHELAQAWQQLDYTTDMQVNAAATTIVTTPGVQLLISLAKTLQASGNRLRITQVNPNVSSTFQQLGLDAYLAEWQA